MTSHLRSFLAAAGILAAAAAFQPSLHAQGFGGMFSGFQMNGVKEDDESETSTVITASAADIDLEHDIIVLIGNVVVDDDSNKITCNKMTIYLEQDAADTLVGTADKPAEDTAKAKPAPAPSAIKPGDENGGKAKKDEDEDEGDKKNISKIVCTGDVVYTKRADPDDPKGQDQIAMSDQAEYDARKEIIVMTGSPVMMQGANKMHGDRIEILIKDGNRMRVINPKINYIGDSFLSNNSKSGGNR